MARGRRNGNGKGVVFVRNVARRARVARNSASEGIDKIVGFFNAVGRGRASMLLVGICVLVVVGVNAKFDLFVPASARAGDPIHTLITWIRAHWRAITLGESWLLGVVAARPNTNYLVILPVAYFAGTFFIEVAKLDSLVGLSAVSALCLYVLALREKALYQVAAVAALWLTYKNLYQ
jgi:hypothetical protein